MRDGLRILGHEASGTIVKLGENVSGNFKVGQKVAMDFRSTCGGCYYCSNKMAHFCERVANFSGVMAEYAVFPQGIVFPLPEELPLVNIDAVLIERVLCNLLENAAKYTPDGTPVRLAAESAS